MNDATRVLVVSYLPPTPGGIATWAGLLRDQPTSGELRMEFLRVPASGTASNRNPVPGIGAALGLLLQVSHRLVFDRPDLLHVNCSLSPRGVWRDLLVAAAARAAGRTVVAHYHGSLPDVVPRLPLLSRAVLRRLMRLASLNVAVTPLSQRVLERLSRSTEVLYLPNFVEEELIRARPRANLFRTARCRAIYVGRLSRDKGTPDLLRTARAVPSVDFELVGEVLDEVRDSLGSAPPNVVVTGPLPRPRVIERLLASDLFVFPSRREGFPNALLEAMAVGLPVVASRVGAVNDMIEEGQGGFLVEPGDAVGLTTSIERLAADRGARLRMGAHNRGVCAARFAAPVVVSALASIYRRAASSTARRKRAALDAAGAAEQGVSP